MPTPAYRPDRLRRAWQLVKSGRVKQMSGTQFAIAGNVEPVYYVDVMAEIPCTCRDEEYRGEEIKHQCKHLLAAKLARLDAGLLNVIVDWIEAEEKEKKERASRRRTTVSHPAPRAAEG